MKKYTDRDLNRPWSSEEVAALSERELTKLTFFRNYKNFVFFIPAVFVLYLISGSFGIIGKIAGWIGVIVFAAFALQGLFNTGVVFISLIGTPFLNNTCTDEKYLLEVSSVVYVIWKLCYLHSHGACFAWWNV